MKKKILIIDGQGGMLGKQVVSGVKDTLPQVEVIVVGTNSIATATMLKAGADRGATGENAAIVASREADIIVGPVGIVVADALMGEITPEMAKAVGQSRGVKILIPLNKCNTLVAGVKNQTTKDYIADAVNTIKKVVEEREKNC